MPRYTRLLFATTLVVLSGCSTYTPVTNPAVGTTVRLRVPLQSAVADPNAAAQTVGIEGVVLESGDTIVLATKTRRELSAFQEIIQFDTFRVARQGLTGMDRRDFSQGRSIALGIAIAGGATGLALSALGIQGGQAGEPSPGDGSNTQGTIVVSSIVSLVWKLIGG